MKAYKLGEHILLHADSIKDKDFILKHAPKIDAIITDPPYGVAYVENKKAYTKDGSMSNLSKAKEIANDDIQDQESYAEFTKAWIEAIKSKLKEYNQVYIFHADTMHCALRKGFEAAGGFYSQLIIWIKNQVVVGRKDYLPQHELIMYGWIGKHKFKRAKAKSVVFYPKPSKSKKHPTMKPVGLIRQLILDSTDKGDWIYEPFAGSGTTIIAAEQTHRKVFAVELDKEYIDVIIERWEKLTGQKAEELV